MRRCMLLLTIVAALFAGMLVALPWPSPSLHSAQVAEGLDINTASGDQLVVLPGIGPAFAKNIIEARPYKAKEELVQRMIIPQATYDTVKDEITVKRRFEAGQSEREIQSEGVQQSEGVILEGVIQSEGMKKK